MYAVVSIGSNVAEARAMIAQALDRLALQASATVVRASDMYVVTDPYVNNVTLISTPLDYPTLHAATKRIERELGRTPELKATGLVPIDIDIVLYDGRLLRPADYAAPWFGPGHRQIINP